MKDRVAFYHTSDSGRITSTTYVPKYHIRCMDCRDFARRISRAKSAVFEARSILKSPAIYPDSIVCYAHRGYHALGEEVFIPGGRAFYIPVYERQLKKWTNFDLWIPNLHVLDWDNFRDSHHDSQEIIQQAPTQVIDYLTRRKQESNERSDGNQIMCRCSLEELVWRGCPSSRGLPCITTEE